MNKTDRLIAEMKNTRLLSSKEIASFGISREYLRKMVKNGVIRRVRRGLYSLVNTEASIHYSLAEAAKIIPDGVICLLSALSFHGLTTQNPREVWIAVNKRWNPPWNDFPVRIIHGLSKEVFTKGVEEHVIDGVKVKIYSPERTVADCFKFRNKIGLDVAIEALKERLQKKKRSVEEIMRFARICRVSNIIRPYLEALVG
jgi:predicted transcriptional regulator of viral defense system